MKSSQYMTEGSIASAIIRFSIPLFLGSVFQQLYNVVDSIILGQFVGKEAMAAVGVSFPITFLLIALVMGLTMGSMVLISQYYGAKNIQKVKLTISTTTFILLWTVVVVTLLGVLFGGWILKLIRTPGDIFFMAHRYTMIMFLGMFALFGYNGLSAILRGMGDSKTPLYLLIFSTILNILLDLLFVLVWKWGVEGVAVATVIAQAFSFVFGLLFLFKKSEFFRFRPKEFRFDWDIMKKSLAIGMPSGVQQVMVAIGSMILVGLVNAFGTDAIAAFTAAGRIESFTMMPAMNISMAISTFVGQNIGAGREDRVKQGVGVALVMATLLSVVLSLLMVTFAESLVMIFNRDASVVRIGREYMWIVAPFYLAFMVMFVFNGALRGAGDTFIPMIITILSLWGLRIPVSVFFSRYWGTNGIWWGIPVAWLFGMVFSGLYFLTGRWRNKVVVKEHHIPLEALEAVAAFECEENERKECLP
ncbi:MATE family efflux transporter [Thermospira aquatica]|uniref:Multidrug-efflux transporter n=1 Tax=Thermospira aquatica TaxID=2828656 RepID=A0AAX3BEL0_9SPIR|nr:MATE family efflux transporter [Thermospira aquatica]URA10784.1 MATE family efflux transporter [Thermospira aquatica]